jgi:hypothetical protein
MKKAQIGQFYWVQITHADFTANQWFIGYYLGYHWLIFSTKEPLSHIYISKIGSLIEQPKTE